MKRTVLINFLSNKNGNKEKGRFITKVLRGNSLWSLWVDNGIQYIICYQLINKGLNEWDFIRESEEDHPSTISCPLSYLESAKPVCEEWRKDCYAHLNKIKDITKKIKDLHRKKKYKQTVRIELTAKEGYLIFLHLFAMKKAVLYLNRIHPQIVGRFPLNNLLYKIPLRLVTDISIIHENDMKEDTRNIEFFHK